MMESRLHKYVKWIGILLLFTFFFLGFISVFNGFQPFWLDEWFVIHNLKFKTSAQLWGTLDFMQQFPRVYLQVVKGISSSFNYSYTSLRIISFIVHTSAIICLYFLGRRLLGKNVLLLMVWVLLYCSFKTSVEYYVQVKQYTMEMFTGVVALWQVWCLHQILTGNKLKVITWILLCLSVAGITFFSYTYPILAIALWAVVLLRAFTMKTVAANVKWQIIVLFIINLLSIALFYWVDVRHVLADQGMQNYWEEYIMGNGFNLELFFTNVYKVFAHLGSGALFEIIFAVFGFAGWALGISHFRRNIKSNEVWGTVVSFSTVLILLMIILFVAGKLPLGAHRLNAFATPAIALLVMNVFVYVRTLNIGTVNRVVMPIVLAFFFLALGIGLNLSMIDRMGKEMIKKRDIYKNVSAGLESAHQKQWPILADRSIVYPNERFKEISGDWVIKTYPAYDVNQSLHVYAVDDTTGIKPVMHANNIDTALYITADNVATVTYIRKPD